MTILNHSNEFVEWLRECPVVWIRLDHNDIYSTYRFYDDINTEDEDDA